MTRVCFGRPTLEKEESVIDRVLSTPGCAALKGLDMPCVKGSM